MRIPKAPPRTIQRTVQRPAADAGGASGASAPAADQAGAAKKSATDPGSIKSAKAALVGFGQTEDATADINPLTSPTSKVDRGEEDGMELAGIPAGFMKSAMLPSEMGAEKAEGLADASPFAPQDAAFDAAGGDMERGLGAQRAMAGNAFDVETVEDPSSVGTMDDGKGDDPLNPSRNNKINASTREGLGIAIGGATEATGSSSSLDQDFASQQWDTRMQGLPSRNNKS